MKISHFNSDITSLECDSIIIGHFENEKLSGSAALIDEASNGTISKLIARGDLGHKHARIRQLYDLPGIKAPRVMVLGLGKSDKFDGAKYIKACTDAAARYRNGPVQNIALTLMELDVKGRNDDWKAHQGALSVANCNYIYDRTKKQDNFTGISTLTITGASAETGRANPLATGIARAKELGNLPPNICNPDYLVGQANEIASQYDHVELDVLNEEKMAEMGMNALLAVGQGSANQSHMIVLKYQGLDKSTAPHVLVGKGITFDTGGISLKPGANMHEMKYDMCGAASVIGTFEAVVSMQLPINLITIVPAVENMPDGKSYRPGDILTSMSGKTIEVLNTDAEGRLILCDALSYAQTFKPQSLIDVATLTGACVIALGAEASGIMSKHDDFAKELLDAGTESHDRGWQLPLWDEYQPLIDTEFADMANVGGRMAGTITAGCFLSRFTEGVRWTHVDVAGTAMPSGKKGGATGRPVGMLTQYLINKSEA
ncbi:MAG: leucyl aminopeptidase [bacterium]